MGKMRKIEIDDSMPCNKFDEFFLPKCENLEELWPAILTKALIKLYSYKIVSNSFKECGDFEPFYALTGYVPEKINLYEKGLYKMFDVKKKVEEEENKEEENKETENKENKETENKQTENNQNDNIIIDEEENEKDEKTLNKDFSKTSLISKNGEDDSFVLFLESALNDENYQKENFIVLCYKKTEEKELDKNKELVHQKTYKKIRELKRLNTFIQKDINFSTKNLHEELSSINKYKRKVSLKTQNLSIEKITDDIENEKRKAKKLATVAKSKYFQSSGNIRNSLNSS
jgi:hypothetical protein